MVAEVPGVPKLVTLCKSLPVRTEHNNSFHTVKAAMMYFYLFSPVNSEII